MKKTITDIHHHFLIGLVDGYKFCYEAGYVHSIVLSSERGVFNRTLTDRLSTLFISIAAIEILENL